MDKKESKLLGLRVGAQDHSGNSNNHYIPKQKVSTLLLPAVILLVSGFFIFAGWDQLLPPVKVDADPAVAVKSKGGYTAKGQIAFQAAGWVEPAPLVTIVSAQVDGIVKKVEVIEGQTVKRGDVIAVLIDEYLQLDLKEAETELEKRKNAVSIAKAELEMACAAKEHQTTRIKTAEAELARLESKSAILHRAGYAVSKMQKEQIAHECNVQQTVLREAKTEIKIFNAAVSVKKAMLKAAEVKLRQHLIKIERIKLDIRRTRIKSPVDGIIMKLHACLGSKYNADSDAREASTIAELYRPEMLQVRVDVPLSNTGNLSVGQEAIIELDVLPGKKFKGEVTSIVGMADIQRNTLQAKVKIEKPSLKLRPNMLAKVQFLAMAQKNITGAGERLRIFIPERSIKNRLQENGEVWIIDKRTGKARKVNITLGNAHNGDWVEVKAGIRPGQLVITGNTANLKDEMRVKRSEAYWRSNNATY